ncbi:MAG: type II toxin-antitoxin system prevent-host-death family antitoxin [Acidobacteriota bacterium]
MEYAISATTLARQLGDVLGRVRYRGESFVIERNGTVVARLLPAHDGRRTSLRNALDAWREAGEADSDFAAVLERVGAADLAQGNPWAS